MKAYLRNHRTLFFFVLAFLLSWSIWLPMALDHYALLPIRLDPNFVLVGRMFGTLGPALSAIIVTLVIGGRLATRDLLGRLKIWRVGWAWYAAACLVFPALIFVTAGLYRLLPGAAPLPFQQVSAGSLLVTMIILTITVLGEEIGWRGFALPALQKQFPALQSSLILGTIWTAWHLPFWTVLGELERFGWGYWLMSWAWILGGTIFITWLMNNTGSSLLIAVLFHWCFNVVSVGYLPITTVIPAYAIFIGLTWAIALGLLVRFGARRLAVAA